MGNDKPKNIQTPVDIELLFSQQNNILNSLATIEQKLTNFEKTFSEKQQALQLKLEQQRQEARKLIIEAEKKRLEEAEAKRKKQEAEKKRLEQEAEKKRLAEEAEA